MFNKKLISLMLLNLAIFAASNTSLDSDRAQPELMTSYSICDSDQENTIDIHDKDAIYNSHLKPFNFINFDKTMNWAINKSSQNLPMLFTLNSKSNVSLEVDGSNFNETYNIWQFYFSWGETDNQGSRFKIDGKKYPLELHLVSVSPSEAFSVISFVFTKSNDDNPALQNILDVISSLRSNSSKTEFDLALSTILPSSSKPIDYYRYNGNSSCKGFTWSIMEQPIQISSKQLSVFRETQTTKTNRHVEKSSSREIYSSRKERREVKSDIKTNIIPGSGRNGASFNSFSYCLFSIFLSFKLFF